MTKAIAKSLKNLLKNDVVSASLDRAYNISAIWPDVYSAWSVDILARRPSPSFKEVDEEMVFVEASNLGLHPWLATIAQRQGVIVFPEYNGIRPKVERSDELTVSSKDRKGNLSAIVANAKSHAHSVRFKDFNIVRLGSDGSQKIGAWRNFTVVDDGGNLYNGWKVLRFFPTNQEKEFIRQHHQVSDSGKIVVDDWVHDNLAFAFMGSRYLSTAILEQRLTEEKLFYGSIERGLIRQRIFLPKKGYSSFDFICSRAPGISKSVDALEALVVVKGLGDVTSLFKGNYPIRAQTYDGPLYDVNLDSASRSRKVDVLRYVKNRRHTANVYQGFLRSAKRTVELAAKNWIDKHGSLPNPGWNIPDWDQGTLKPRARINYNLLDLGDLSLAYRIRHLTVRVSP